MVKKKKYGQCRQCNKQLTRDEYGLSIKFYGEENSKYCIECMASQLGVSKEDILEKIEEYKDEGCKLFQ